MSENESTVWDSDGSRSKIAAQIFSLLSNEDRLEILMTLSEAIQTTHHQKFGFNEFWKAVDIEDSGRFNYHLDQLCDTFIRETEDGYTLTYSGVLISLLLMSGKLTRNPEMEPRESSTECPDCRGTVMVSYRDKLVVAECDDCEKQLMKMRVPPGCVDVDSADHMLRAAIQYALREIVTLRDEICPNCGGHAFPTIVPVEQRPDEEDKPTVYFECSNCEYFFRTGVSYSLLTHPELVSFCRDHGYDVLAPENPQIVVDLGDEQTVSVHSRDPLQFEFSLELDDETLTLLIDDDMTVLESSRQS